MNLSPRYEHDCPACALVGMLAHYDVYICGNQENIVARWSDYGPDYLSDGFGKELWLIDLNMTVGIRDFRIERS